MSRYYDYFEEQSHTNGEAAIDEFIAEAMRTDLKFKTLAEEVPFDWALWNKYGGHMTAEKNNLHILLDKPRHFLYRDRVLDWKKY